MPKRPSLNDWFICEESEEREVVDEEAAEFVSGRLRCSAGGNVNGLGELAALAALIIEGDGGRRSDMLSLCSDVNVGIWDYYMSWCHRSSTSS